MLNPISWKAFLPKAKALISGLLFAHNNRIIHGNLRPSNIVFDENDTIKLTDFGIREPEKLNKQRKSRYKIVNETPSIQADIYALGVVFYQMLTGQYPLLQGKTSKDKQFNENKFYRQLPSKLKKLLIEMLQLNSRERPGSCLPILNVIDEIMVESAQAEIDQTVLMEVPEKKGYFFNKWYLLILLLLTILALGYFFTAQIQDFSEIIYQTIVDLFSVVEEKPTDEYIEF